MKINCKKKSLITASLFTLVSITYCSLLVSKAKSQTPKLLSQNEYPQDFSEAYQASCKINAVTKGLSTEQAETLCDCTLNQFQSKYTLEKFRKLINKAANEETPEELIEVGEICAEELIN